MHAEEDLRELRFIGIVPVDVEYLYFRSLRLRGDEDPELHAIEPELAYGFPVQRRLEIEFRLIGRLLLLRRF